MWSIGVRNLGQIKAQQISGAHIQKNTVFFSVGLEAEITVSF